MSRKQWPIVVIVSVAAFVVLSAAMFISTSKIDRTVREQSFERLEYNAAYLADQLHTSTSIDTSILSVMAHTIEVQGDIGEINNKILLDTMNSFKAHKSYISYIAYLSCDYRLINQNGISMDVSGRIDFDAEAKAAPFISEIREDLFDASDRVVVNAVPVRQNNRVVGILYGVVSLSKLSELYTADIYDGKAYIYLVDGTSGDFLLDTWHKELGNFYSLGERKMLPGYDYNKMCSDIKTGTTGHVGFTSNTTGDTLYMYYQPTGINNWNVIITVEERIALIEAKEVNKLLLWTIIIETITLLLYMAFIVILLLRLLRKIRILSHIDQATELQNRNAYEKYIFDSKDRVFASIICVYIDVNGLHEINNKFGHKAGDQMLRTIADVLKTEFHSNQLYRVGGDEFTVFMENDSADLAEAKMQKVQEKVEAYDYRIAVGIVYREQERGLKRIIQEADERMLKNKQDYYKKHDRRKER